MSKRFKINIFMASVRDITGERFGRLVAVECVGSNTHKKKIWLCKCDCGNTTQVEAGNLKNGKILSCKCLNREKTSERFKKHGAAGTRLYSIWKGVRKRCYNENSSRYKWYGAKGISITPEWDDFAIFSEWAMTNGYDETLTIDRRDSDKNYSPDNCRWITVSEQQRTKKGNRHITIGDETLILADWCKKLNIVKSTIYRRCRAREIEVEDYVKQVYDLQKTAIA